MKVTRQDRRAVVVFVDGWPPWIHDLIEHIRVVRKHQTVEQGFTDTQEKLMIPGPRASLRSAKRAGSVWSIRSAARSPDKKCGIRSAGANQSSFSLWGFVLDAVADIAQWLFCVWRPMSRILK
ncbi:unnamed protein product [Arctogadus glacialis]